MLATDPLVETLEDFIVTLMALSQLDGIKQIEELELSISQARILMVVGTAGEPMPIHAIADQVGLSVAAAGRNVDHLVHVGVVTRAESPVDRRVKLVALTALGEDAVASHLEAKRDVMQRFVQRLTAGERDALDSALRAAVVSAMRDLDPAQVPSRLKSLIGERP